MTRRPSAGFTLIELLIVIAIIGIVASVAIPGLLRARQVGMEASAISSMRTIGSAQAAYRLVCGSDGFATSLPVLGTPPPGGTDAFVGPDLSAAAAVTKSGYVITMDTGAGGVAGPADCNGTVTHTSYYATAVPVVAGMMSSRAFAIDDLGQIWQDTSGTAPAQPFTIAGTVSPLQ